jgi:putative Holliday junction resolvase
MYCKYLGLDFGEKTIGVAVSVNGRVATSVRTLRRKDPAAIRANLKELKAIIREHDITHLVLGYPKNMDGSESARCVETKVFRDKLQKFFKKDVVLWDERLSTRAVTRTFEGSRVNYKKNVDTMAAVYILQGYLDYINTYGKEEIVLTEEVFDEFEEEDDESDLVVVGEDGEEHPLTILASQQDANDIYLLAAEDVTGAVYHFKCQPAADDDDDVILEQIDKEHDDFKRVFEMFKDEYESLGIDVEDIA